MSNHYHALFSLQAAVPPLPAFVRRFHGATARGLNARDATPGRKVWFQYWDSRITYEASLLARLRYVHTNPAHHRVVDDPESYPWCSAAWFARSAPKAFVETVSRFKTDRLSVHDDF